MKMSSVRSILARFKSGLPAGPSAAMPRVRRDPTTLATGLLAVIGAALIAASAAADSNLLGDSANACPKCHEGVCFKEVVTYRCKQVPDNKPIKKTVYECREVPYCLHKLPRLGHGGCCPECEACPRFKKVLVKKEVVVGETCGTKCVPEKFVERVPVPCCRCGYAPTGPVPTPAPAPTAEPKPADAKSITSLTLGAAGQQQTQAARRTDVPPSAFDASSHSAVSPNPQRMTSSRRLATTSPSTRSPRDEGSPARSTTAVATTAAVMDEPAVSAERNGRLPATENNHGNLARRAIHDQTVNTPAIPVDGQLIELSPPDSH